MKKYTLQAQKREVTGRQVKKLRRQGQLPATIYGKKVASVSVTVRASDFAKVYEEAGETGLVELTLEGKLRPVLIHNVQKHPVTSRPLHVEFYQVDLKEKVRTEVPVVVVGESPAVAQKVGVILTLLNEVEVEALPADLPEKITVDVSALSEVDQELRVGDLKVPSGVSILTEANVVVVKVGALVSKEAEAEAVAEAAAAATAAAEALPEAEAPEAPAEPTTPPSAPPPKTEPQTEEK